MDRLDRAPRRQLLGPNKDHVAMIITTLLQDNVARRG